MRARGPKLERLGGFEVDERLVVTRGWVSQGRGAFSVTDGTTTTGTRAERWRGLVECRCRDRAPLGSVHG